MQNIPSTDLLAQFCMRFLHPAGLLLDALHFTIDACQQLFPLSNLLLQHLLLCLKLLEPLLEAQREASIVSAPLYQL